MRISGIFQKMFLHISYLSVLLVLNITVQGCSGDEREMAKTLADIISKREKNVIAEGQEPADFWVNLGGKSQYASSKRYSNICTLHIVHGKRENYLLGSFPSPTEREML